MVTTYLRLVSELKKPEEGQSGAGELAGILASGLRKRGFSPGEPCDGEFAHFIKCKSGEYEYEIMVAFDFIDGNTWEISCQKKLGVIAKIMGRSEDRELGALIKAIHDTMRSDFRIKSLSWNKSYGDTELHADNPIVEP